jgi:hypothetical protein
MNKTLETMSADELEHWLHAVSVLKFAKADGALCRFTAIWDKRIQPMGRIMERETARLLGSSAFDDVAETV